MGKKKILLVDDSEIYRDMARYMLESRGYDVVTLSSPFAFGAAITREQPDLALVDAYMPALQGDQLIRLARQNNLWDCPIVLHSDRSGRELQAMMETCGASGFLAKTNDADKLATAIETFLREAKATAQARRPPPASQAEPMSVGRRPVGSPESRRLTPSPDSFRPAPESYRAPPESRSPPESRRPPPPSESRRPPNRS